MATSARAVRDLSSSAKRLTHGSWFEGPGRGPYDAGVLGGAQDLATAAEELDKAADAMEKKAAVIRAEQALWAIADAAYRTFRAAQDLL